MPSNTELTNEYFSIMRQLNGDIAGRTQAYAYMQQSSAIVHDRVVASTFVPRLFNNETWNTFKTIAETAHTILSKVMQEYLNNPTYRQIFSFDKRLEELILLPRNYEAILPFARIDVFLDEDSLACGFCEINGDGSAGMNENREITHSIEQSATFRTFASHHQIEACELFYAWVDEFIAIYNTYCYKVEHPRFAICDYLECGVVDEFKVFCDHFADRGYACTVCDVRDLRFDGTALYDPDGQRIDAIWRRCVTNDVLDNWDDSQDLIEALRHEAVALIGSFAGHLVHDKQIFSALFHPQTQAFLSEEEQAFVRVHVPQTRFLDESEVDLNEIRATKDQWIIKPTDFYGARDVFDGKSLSQAEWDALIDRVANSASGHPFIVQTYITPYRTLTLPPDTALAQGGEDTPEAAPCEGAWYNNLSGLYLYNGRFQGVFSRLGPHPTISKEHEGITAASIHVLDA